MSGSTPGAKEQQLRAMREARAAEATGTARKAKAQATLKTAEVKAAHKKPRPGKKRKP